MPLAWDPAVAVADFAEVAKLAGADLSREMLKVETLLAPHFPPSRLPAGYSAVYVFSFGVDVLKVGKVGPRSHARYASQHYSPDRAPSTLAASLLADRERYDLTDEEALHLDVWLKAKTDRVNILVDSRDGMALLSLLEAFLHCRLRPRYEGFKSQM